MEQRYQSNLDRDYQGALAKLRWSDEWSASLTPAECKALLWVLEEHGLATRPGTVDHPYSGDPGDEQP